MSDPFYTIEELTEGSRIPSIENLIRKVFMDCIASTYAEEGIRNFLDYVSEKKIRERQKEGGFWLIAVHKGDLIGAIEMKNESHLSLLFVDKAWHHRGIARALFQQVKAMFYQKHSKDALTVNSTPNAIDFYIRMGFLPLSHEQEQGGIRFVPMQLALCNVASEGKDDA
jgi:GNAT superfamily N-acetyltransferase